MRSQAMPSTPTCGKQQHGKCRAEIVEDGADAEPDMRRRRRRNARKSSSLQSILHCGQLSQAIQRLFHVATSG